MCSKCEPDGLRGPAVREELLEIHGLAMDWAQDGWFTYEVEWDSQSGIHWITVVPDDDAMPMCYSVCEFQAFIRGLQAATQRGTKESL